MSCKVNAIFYNLLIIPFELVDVNVTQVKLRLLFFDNRALRNITTKKISTYSLKSNKGMFLFQHHCRYVIFSLLCTTLVGMKKRYKCQCLLKPRIDQHSMSATDQAVALFEGHLSSMCFTLSARISNCRQLPRIILDSLFTKASA